MVPGSRQTGSILPPAFVPAVLFSRRGSVATILFVSEACLLDRKSGAAQSVRAILAALADAGHECHAVTMSVFDGEADYPLPEQIAEGCAIGGTATFQDGAVQHRVYRSASTQIGRVRPWELIPFQKLAVEELGRLKPDLVLTYCSQALWPVLNIAQLQGARTVFYVGTAAYAERSDHEFRHIDNFVLPSQALADLYLQKRGIKADVVKNIIDAKAAEPSADHAAGRHARFVTMVNPEPVKGGAFFLQLVAEASVSLPHIRFMAVEGRWGQAQWEASGVDMRALPNLTWHPTTQDMASVYDQSAMLLMPTLNFEGSGRVVLEAMQAGLPVLAMDMGGLAEQLDNGGFLFECPQALRDSMGARPDPAYLRQWLHFVAVLMKDDALYAQAVDLAVAAARRAAPDLRRKAAVAVFEAWLAAPAGLGENASPQSVMEISKLRRQMSDALARAEHASQLALPGDGALGPESEEPAFAEVSRLSSAQPALRDAVRLAASGANGKAIDMLSRYVRLMPEDCMALSLLGDLLLGEGHFLEAGALYARASDVAPGLVPAQLRLAAHLAQQGDFDGALATSFNILEMGQGDPDRLGHHAQLLLTCAKFEEAVAVFEALFRQFSGTSVQWMGYGDALRAVGRSEDAANAFDAAVLRDPGNGQAWYHLAEVRRGKLTEDQLIELNRQCLQPDATRMRALHHFAMGIAKEALEDFEGAFASYALANADYASGRAYDAAHIEAHVADARRIFSSVRAENDVRTAAPIFIIGMHRSGTTLVEQILASHSEVEGTRELPFLPRIAGYFGGFDLNTETSTPISQKLLADLSEGEIARLAQSYLEGAATARSTLRTHFTDKLPSNWMHVGLILKLFPDARIIDVRRDPVATGLAQFRKPLGDGVGHAQSFASFARYYHAYADLMTHFDEIAPGRIHHVRYEGLVATPDAEIENLLGYCGLAVEPGCLEFWKTERPVATPSAEQVRQPLSRDSVDHWEKFRPWLGDLEAALGQEA